MAEEKVGETLEEAAEAHEDAPTAATAPGQPEATRGEGVQPPEVGYAPPDTGQGEGAESEIPVGVDALTDEQKASAQENAPGDEGGEGGALDVSAIVADADDDTEPPDAEADAEPPDAEAEPPDAEADAEPPDADAEPPDTEA